MATLVLLRHGQSAWNLENRFTGWQDVDLTDLGEAEGQEAGRAIAAAGVAPDVAHTSLQLRAIRTLDLALRTLGRHWIPVHKSWRLNERHYGALEGLDKADTLARYGEEQFRLWRRSYDVPPPALELDDERHPRHDPRFAALPPEVLPASECLADVVVRLVPYWQDRIAADLGAGKTVMVAAHGNSLRALVKHIDGLTADEVLGLNIPTGVPLVYELDDVTLRPVEPTGTAFPGTRAVALGDPEEVIARAAAVAAQGTTPSPAEAAAQAAGGQSEPDEPQR